LYFIKHHNREAHRTSMLLAFAFSSVFLISYIVNHALHGDTIFPGHGPVRTLYLSILASHVILSVVALPMVLTTFFFSLYKSLLRSTEPAPVRVKNVRNWDSCRAG
jgi:putative membrane protein